MGRIGRALDWLLTAGTATPDLLAMDPPGVAVSAAAGPVSLTQTSTTGPNGQGQVGWGFGPPLQPFDFPDWQAPPWWDRDAAMTLPTISRGVQMITQLVGALPFTLWTRQLDQVPIVEQQIPGPSWFERPDPDHTRQWLLAWTTDDLIFHQYAHWEITNRFADTFPQAFARIAPGNLDLRDDGTAVVTDPDSGRQRRIPQRNIVQFCSPIDGLLTTGWRAVSIALQLDAAADRFAGTEVPAGVLEEQEGSEDMSAEDGRAMAEAFSLARRMNTTAWTNKYLRYRETSYDPAKMQIVEGRTYQALELARLANIPPYLVGAPAGTGMTYQNGQQARQDLVDFGAAGYIACIEQTLSGPNVTPRGQAVRLDLNVWLRNPFTTDPSGEPSPNDLQVADPTQPPSQTEGVA
jgi:hypothetical protein